MPDTKPGIVFDDQGICSACRWIEQKKTIDWDARAARLKEICDAARGSNGNGYECIVPVSGGKDSVYQAYVMSKLFGLRTLCVIVAPHLQTREGILNLNALVENIGVDLLKVAVRPTTLKKIRRMAFMKIGNPNYAEHRVVFAAVARASLFYNVPLVVWGEDIATEYGGNIAASVSNDGSAEDLASNDLFRESSFEDLLEGTIPENELFFYHQPSKEELARRKVKSIYLGYYHYWDGYRNYEVAKRFGFRPREEGPLPGNVVAYNNIDEKLCEVQYWFKFLKLGFGRATDAVCQQIWNGRLTREEGVELVKAKQYELPAYIPEFLEYHQISELDFWQTADKFRNRDLFHMVGNEWRLKEELT